MATAKDLNDLSTIYLEAVYGGEKKKEEKKDTRYVVTSADIKGGTRAAQELDKGNPRYKKADHLKNSVEIEFVNKLIESGQFSEEEIVRIIEASAD